MVEQRRKAVIQARQVWLADVDRSTRKSAFAASLAGNRRGFLIERVQCFGKWTTIRAFNRLFDLRAQLFDLLDRIERLLHTAISFERQIELLRERSQRGLHAR